MYVIAHLPSCVCVCLFILSLSFLCQSGVSSPPEMPPDLVEKRKSDRLFLEQLLDTSKLENYSVPISINTHLRKYQQVSVTVYVLFSLNAQLL